MDRGRHRKSKSASGIEGIQRMPKHKIVLRLSSDCRLYTDGNTKEDTFVLDLGRSHSRMSPGTPMKKLLAEEMSKEVEPKKRSPSVIAKLMGLEGLASPRHVNRQQKVSSYQQKNVSVDSQSNRQLYDGLSSSRSSGEMQEFKDVYEDLEASHFVNRYSSPRWSKSSMLPKRNMAFIEENLIDAKCRHTDEKAMVETLEMLHSNKDFFLNFLQPDPSSVKQLHYHSNSPGSPIAVLKPSRSANHDDNYKSWNSERENSSRRGITSNLKRKDGLLLEKHNRNKAYISHRSPEIQLEDKNVEKILPTRIVVLKPHIRKVQNSRMSFSSPDHLHDISNLLAKKEYPTIGNGEIVLLRRKDSSQNVGTPKPVSKEAREIARKIARRMKDACDEIVDEKSTCFRGYAGDESSFEADESDSDSESEVTKSSSGQSFGNNVLRINRSCHLAESSVSREAKHRLSERWKMTQRYQDLEIIPKGSTLGEMLASPERAMMPRQLGGKVSHCKESRKLDNSYVIGTSYCPVGISTRDGWKVETSKTSSRSRSSHPSGGRRSNGKSIYHDEVAEDKHLICSDAIRRSRNSRIKKPFPCPPSSIADTGSSSDAKSEIRMVSRVQNLSELQPLQTAPTIDAFRSSATNVLIIAEHGSKTLFSESSDILPKEGFSVVVEDKSAAHDLEYSRLQELEKGLPGQDSPLQCLGSELNSSGNSKTADLASPDSVLEIPFGEDTSSSSESFERVGAELHELRMQIQLLKMESGSCPEDEALESTQLVNEENLRESDECWEISYANDVLNDSGLEESGYDMFISKWYSQDCPLDPQLFEDLESKHRDETSASWCERRLLFDRINYAILEIFQEQVDLLPWVPQKTGGFYRDGIEEVLERLISQEDDNAEFTMRGLDKVLTWRDSKEEVDELGNVIEKFMMDDLVIEVICELCGYRF